MKITSKKNIFLICVLLIFVTIICYRILVKSNKVFITQSEDRPSRPHSKNVDSSNFPDEINHMPIVLKEFTGENSENSRIYSENQLGELGGGTGGFAIYKNGIMLFNRGAPITSAQVSPDDSKILISGEGFWGELYNIQEEKVLKMNVKMPNLGDIQWVWLGNKNLIGVANLYDEDHPHECKHANGCANLLIKNSELYYYSIDKNHYWKIPWPNINLKSDEIFQIHSVTSTGIIEIAIIKKEMYFSNTKNFVRSVRYTIEN